MSKYLITSLLCLLTCFSQAQELEDDVYYYSFWEYQPQDTGYVFIDQARIRSTPQLDGQLVDSLSSATPITILKRVNNQTYIRGLHAPWYKVSYVKNSQTHTGYIWGGMLALQAKKTNKEKNLFLSGIHWSNYSSPQDSTGHYYWMGIKVFNNQKVLLCNKEFAFPSFDQTFTDAKVYSNKGLQNATNIYAIGLYGEACGIPTNIKYFAWHNNQLTEIISTTRVSDAGVYYYDEELQFPSEHRGNTQMIVKKIEEGETDEQLPYSNSDPYTKVTKRTLKFLWDGKTLKPIK